MKPIAAKPTPLPQPSITTHHGLPELFFEPPLARLGCIRCFLGDGEAARGLRKSVRRVGEDDLAYDSSRGLAEQQEAQTAGFDDFDKRLEERN